MVVFKKVKAGPSRVITLWSNLDFILSSLERHWVEIWVIWATLLNYSGLGVQDNYEVNLEGSTQVMKKFMVQAEIIGVYARILVEDITDESIYRI